jgi:hypothetical protein
MLSKKEQGLNMRILALTTSIMLAIAPSTMATALSWDSISKGPKELGAAVQRKGPTPTARYTRIMQPHQAMPLYLIDLNSSDECGAGGCSVEAYILRGKNYRLVLEILSDARLPPPQTSNDFVSIADVSREGMPCLDFKSGSGVDTARWCFNGKKYSFSKRVPANHK